MLARGGRKDVVETRYPGRGHGRGEQMFIAWQPRSEWEIRTYSGIKRTRLTTW